MLSHDLQSLAAEFAQRATATAPEMLSPAAAGSIAAALEACRQQAEAMEAAVIQADAQPSASVVDLGAYRRRLAVPAGWEG